VIERAMITDVAQYFRQGCGRCNRFATPTCATQTWAQGLAVLRDLCRATGMAETAKWGHPTYMHAGRNVAIIGAFASDYRLTFFHPALLRDPERALQRQGPNTRHPDMLCFRTPTAAADQAALITAYLTEAMSYAEAGLLPDLPPREVVLPPELIEALDFDPELAEAFAALTPGRQKSWVFHLNSTQVPQTRRARIERARGKILAGKGALDR
jgi:uncharacterized protein YdeI (YjbR/CyaY-like superfamily)